MQASPSGTGPLILHCPHCGAPLDAPSSVVEVRCTYCGHSVKLGDRNAARPLPLGPATARSTATAWSWRAPALVAAVVVAVALVSAAGLRPTPGPASSPLAPTPTSTTIASSLVTTPAVARPAAEVRYPLSSLLGIDMTVDVDGSRAHMLAQFPSAKRIVDEELKYEVLLDHRWFSEVDLYWKNEKSGKVDAIAFNPPAGDGHFKNQKEIADCLAKGLGKPKLVEADHLAGEVTYDWNARFPKATASLYSNYLWLRLEDPRGAPPITFPQVVRTLAGCALQTP